MRMTSGTTVNSLKAKYVPYNDGDAIIHDNFSPDIFDDFEINLVYIPYLVICRRCLWLICAVTKL